MFDNGKQTESKVSQLVGGICRLAGCLEGRANASDRENALHDTLKLAYQLEELINQKNEQIAYLDRLAMTDSLTGILNRRGFQVELQRVLASALRFQETGVLAYVDLDGFKAINDNFGHACGDEVLCHVSRVLERMTRGTDYVARLGGDEFAILLVRSGWDDGQNRIEKIANELNTTTLRWKEHIIPIQASIGLQFYNNKSLTHDLMHAADEAMYSIKKIKNSQQDQCTLSAAE
ncbi:MAG: GGDEF domain-containing protein [Methylocystaceae bacterium]|nr:GGDEF domain-containing protein [Methylocystaceae bacterium]